MAYVGSSAEFDAASARPGGLLTNILIAGEVLRAGEQLDTPTQAFSALMRGDGNFVVYRNEDWFKVWSSGTEGHPEASVRVLDDGNVVVRATDGEHLWRSATGGNPGAFMLLHDDGRLVAYDFYRYPLWSSNETT